MTCPPGAVQRTWGGAKNALCNALRVFRGPICLIACACEPSLSPLGLHIIMRATIVQANHCSGRGSEMLLSFPSFFFLSFKRNHEAAGCTAARVDQEKSFLCRDGRSATRPYDSHVTSRSAKKVQILACVPAAVQLSMPGPP